MAALIWSLLLIAFGVAALAYSSDWFVDGAAVLADRLSVPPVVIGTLVIGLGTSLPEVFVSTLAAVDGDLNLGIGNIVGSNTANLTVVLGVAAMIGVVRVDSEIVRREALLRLGSCVLIALLAWQKLTLVGGLVLSTGEGDFEREIGQDFSICYESHTDSAATLYIQESFTFRLLSAEAAVSLEPGANQARKRQ
mgnify:CR=1 FL=1